NLTPIMKISEVFPPLSFVIIFFLLLGFSFFLNYLSALYSEVNLFKVDLVKKRKDKGKTKKLIFILKNGNLLFALICILQVFLNIFMSDLFMTNLGSPILSGMDKSNYRGLVLLGLSLL